MQSTHNAPRLVHAFDVEAEVAAPIVVGQSLIGERRTVPITGGRALGPRLTGTIIPGGVDYQLVRSDGLAEIHARYIIETPTGSRVYIENTGVRRGPPEVIAALRRGEPVDQSLIYFRTTPRFETPDPDLQWLMNSIFVCAASRLPLAVRLSFYEVV